MGFAIGCRSARTPGTRSVAVMIKPHGRLRPLAVIDALELIERSVDSTGRAEAGPSHLHVTGLRPCGRIDRRAVPRRRRRCQLPAHARVLIRLRSSQNSCVSSARHGLPHSLTIVVMASVIQRATSFLWRPHSTTGLMAMTGSSRLRLARSSHHANHARRISDRMAMHVGGRTDR